jgi:hypothetical protein
MSYKDKSKQREYQRQWIAKRRSDFFADKYCVTCSSRDRLELDHIDPSIKVDHRIWSWSQQRREAEITKCQVLCYDCHQQKTITFLSGTTHGTDSMYKKYQCRCFLCKEYKAERNRRRYRK